MMKILIQKKIVNNYNLENKYNASGQNVIKQKIDKIVFKAFNKDHNLKKNIFGFFLHKNDENFFDIFKFSVLMHMF